MRMKEFKQSVIESLGHYVYCLVDPRDNRIFYIGEGCGNRVFNHAYDALNDNLQSLKLDVIRDIISQGMEVKYYIIRHGMTQDVAFLVESVLIDLLTYEPFNLESILTNIQSGHHQWDRGIKTVEEINSIYDCTEIEPEWDDKLIFININKTYVTGERGSIYEATRKYWRLNGNRARQATYALAVYRGIGRAVFKPTRWYLSKDYPGRWEFDGDEIENSPYLNKNTRKIVSGSQNPISYYNM